MNHMDYKQTTNRKEISTKKLWEKRILFNMMQNMPDWARFSYDVYIDLLKAFRVHIKTNNVSRAHQRFLNRKYEVETGCLLKPKRRGRKRQSNTL